MPKDPDNALRKSVITNMLMTMIVDAATFVVTNYPIDLTPEEVYEELVGLPHVLAAFKQAGQYLEPTPYVDTTSIAIVADEVYRYTVALRLPISTTYPQYLMPKYELYLKGDSKLTKALLPVIAIADEWRLLAFTFKFFYHSFDANVACFFMPWVRDLVMDCSQKIDTDLGSKQLCQQVIREFKRMSRPPQARHDFPRLTRRVSEVCRSGSRLFTQSRMLRSAGHGRDLPCIHLHMQRDPDAPDDDYRRALADIWHDWMEVKGIGE